jgi:hypothetical protein
MGQGLFEPYSRIPDSPEPVKLHSLLPGSLIFNMEYKDVYVYSSKLENPFELFVHTLSVRHENATEPP